MSKAVIRASISAFLLVNLCIHLLQVMNIFRCLFYNGCLDHISISSETSLVNPIPCPACVQDSSSVGLLYLCQHLHLERSSSTHGDSEHCCAIQPFCHSNLTNTVVQLCYAQSSSRKDVCQSRCLHRLLLRSSASDSYRHCPMLLN